MVAAIIVAVAAQLNVVPAISSHFECEMRPGNYLAGGEASADDRRFLPLQWRVEIATPVEHGDRIRYVDDVLGVPIDVVALWGYRRTHFSGSGSLVHSEYDWWVDYMLAHTEAGEAVIWNTYLRTQIREGRPRSVELHAIGSCHEIVSFPARNPS